PPPRRCAGLRLRRRHARAARGHRRGGGGRVGARLSVAEAAPYGSWRSPIEPAAVARGGRRLGGATPAADGAVWWAEGRPEEGGRSALMRRAAGGGARQGTPARAHTP